MAEKWYDHMAFQSLIGRLQTKRGLQANLREEGEFQSLIGRLQTMSLEANM